ncbi:MAG: glycosyltransferase [Microgenomates group bacterium]
MKIWAHTLFKNEERWLWFSVTSVIDSVNKLLLWDTGSTDRSWEIALALKEKYKEKIDLRQYGEVTPETFPEVRQAMLDATDADWFIIVDGDEIWWEDSIKKLTLEIKTIDSKTESIVVKNINLVGDIYHHFDESASKYTFGNLKGSYALRAINRNIKGLCSIGRHGVWGWSDGQKQIQERNTFKFVDVSYLHTTFLPRGEDRSFDILVPKRAKKLKYEIGNEFPKNFYYPEAFFKVRPDFVPSPWKPMSNSYKIRALIETPVKKLKRKIIEGKVGY